MLDNGIDLNKDGHCDRCGKFVDEEGHHKISLIYGDRFDIDTLPFEGKSFDNFIKKYYSGDPYSCYWYKNESKNFYKVQIYSRNDKYDKYSAPALNNFLHFQYDNKYDLDGYEKLMRCLSINQVINTFTLKKDLICFRGTSYFFNDAYVSKLDSIIKQLKETNDNVIINDNGFISTSLSLKRAVDYAYANINKNVKVLFAYIAKEGTQCMPLSRDYGTCVYDENEVLFKCFGEYEIVELKKEIKGNTILYRGVILVKKEYRK